MEKQMEVQFFGQARLRLGDNSIDSRSERSKKLWLLLAYLISTRPRPASNAELTELLWGHEAERSAGALKTTVHRLRALLDGLESGAGRRLIVQEAGCYRWAESGDTSIDAEEFERLCSEGFGEKDSGIRAEKLGRALGLYTGPYLEHLSSEAWVVPIAAHYHALYIRAAEELLPLLKELGRDTEAFEAAKKAAVAEPYHEDFHRFMMEQLLEQGRAREAMDIYEALRRRLLDEFGVIPGEVTRKLYHEAVRSINGHLIPMDLIRSQLREEDAAPGCMVCDYEFFKVLYRAEARAIARSGKSVHLSLITLTGEKGGELAPRSLERAMDNLEEVIRTGLRKGDIVSRCSASQFILMLPQANYENSRMVSERVIRAFSRRYPHSPARLDYSVWAMEPGE